MDPLTHGLAGAAMARVALARPLGRAAWLPGVAGALLPDADVFIRSSADPLLYAEFHRHFTHALAFIPIGGAIAALPWALARRTRRHWLACAGAATAGYATHGVLDAGTTYGTLLYWPFSDLRVAWNTLAIVDPFFTLVLAIGVAAAVRRRSAWPAAAALVVCTLYVGVGTVQRDRALAAQQSIADARGHTRTRAAVFPGVGSQLVWRSLYRAGDTLYMDRIRVHWLGRVTWKPGLQVPAVDDAEGGWPDEGRVARDLARFRRFADGWLARPPDDPDVIADARYSQSTGRFELVWGVRVVPDADPPVEWVDRSGARRVDPREVWDELRGSDPAYGPLPWGRNQRTVRLWRSRPGSTAARERHIARGVDVPYSATFNSTVMP